MLKALESFIKALPYNKQTSISMNFVLDEFKNAHSRTIGHSNVFAFLPDYTTKLDNTAIDTKEMSFIPFKNGILQITKDHRKLIDYKSFNGLIWRNSIKDRDFILLKPDEIDRSEIKYFLFLVSLREGDIKEGEAHKRSFYNLIKALGYNLHNYKEPSKTKMIIIIDDDTDNPLRGGAGKSLFTKFTSIIRNVFTIDGKAKDGFLLSGIKQEHDLVVLDDMAKYFNIDELTTALTGDLVVNNKTGKKIQIPFKNAPKFTGNTNYPIDRNKTGMRRRLILLEFNSYFNIDNTPQDVFGHLLIDEWDEKQFNIEDNFLAFCLQYYLKNGLPETNISNEVEKVLKLSLGEIAEDIKSVFEDYIKESSNISNIQKTKEEVRNDVFDNAILNDKSIIAFGMDLKKYCDNTNIKIKPKKYEYNGFRRNGYLFDFTKYLFLS